MRTTHAVLPAVLVALLLAGCSGQSVDPAEEVADSPAEAVEREVEETTAQTEAGTEEEAVERFYAASEQITVELTLYSTDDGGRSTPFFSGYRPTVEFDHLDQSVGCSVQLPAELDQFTPGETHLVGLECNEDVTVHVDEPGLTLVESGKENGEGEVVFTEV